MIRKFRLWLRDRFLPAYCRDDLLAENDRLRRELAEQQRTIEQLRAYADGLEYAARRNVHVKIYNGKEVKGG